MGWTVILPSLESLLRGYLAIQIMNLVMTCLVSIWPYHITPLSLVILGGFLHLTGRMTMYVIGEIGHRITKFGHDNTNGEEEAVVQGSFFLVIRLSSFSANSQSFLNDTESYHIVRPTLQTKTVESSGRPTKSFLTLKGLNTFIPHSCPFPLYACASEGNPTPFLRP